MSRIRFLEARSGDLSALCEGRQLHSRFDPRREAARFVQPTVESTPALVIVIGPGLGYCFAALRTALPRVRTIGIVIDGDLAARAVERADTTWSPVSRIALDEYLTQQLCDLDSASVALIEWPPVAESAPQLAADFRATVVAHLQRAQASLVTRGATGRRWLRNRLFNYLRITPAAPASGGRPISCIVVAAAGPSLERSLPMLRRLRDRIALWATASALDALLASDLRPDLIAVTDAAPYAAQHLRAAIAGLIPHVPVAAPLSATRGLASCAAVLPVSEGDPTDRALLDESAPLVPPHGTVTTSAIGLARRLSAAPIVLAGADFAWFEERSHARPHLSERYRRAAATRIAPEATALFARSAALKPLDDRWASDRSLDTYADWFVSHAVRRYEPVYVVEPSPANAGVAVIGEADLERFPCDAAAIEPRHAVWPDEPERIRRVRIHLDHLRALCDAPSPATPRELERDRHELANMAVDLALPALLRWAATSGRSPAEASQAWDAVRDAIRDELDAIRLPGIPAEDQ